MEKKRRLITQFINSDNIKVDNRITKTINTVGIGVTSIVAHSIEEFNELVKKYRQDDDNELILTKSNNLSQANFFNEPCGGTFKRRNSMEYHRLDIDAEIYHVRIVYALQFDKKSDLDEHVAFEALNYFRNLIPGKDLFECIPEDKPGEEEKIVSCPENPEKAYYNYVNQKLVDENDGYFDNCYSLDRNNSFPASMMAVYPETRPWVEKYYQERLKLKQTCPDSAYYKKFKLYGSIIVGWLNNPKYHRHNAWRKIITNSNQVVHKLRQEIEQAGHEVLLVNTDAIKFIGKYDYKGNNDLGGFKYEYEDAPMYIKSVKSYAYYDNGWVFKQAGLTSLDRVKPDRTTWKLNEFQNARDLIMLIQDDLLIYEEI